MTLWSNLWHHLSVMKCNLTTTDRLELTNCDCVQGNSATAFHNRISVAKYTRVLAQFEWKLTSNLKQSKVYSHDTQEGYLVRSKLSNTQWNHTTHYSLWLQLVKTCSSPTKCFWLAMKFCIQHISTSSSSPPPFSKHWEEGSVISEPSESQAPQLWQSAPTVL